jgi:hypothetical protein
MKEALSSSETSVLTIATWRKPQKMPFFTNSVLCTTFVTENLDKIAEERE